MDGLNYLKGKLSPLLLFFLPLVLLQVRDYVGKLTPEMKSENDSTLRYSPLDQKETHPKSVFLWFVGHSDRGCGAHIRL